MSIAMNISSCKCGYGLQWTMTNTHQSSGSKGVWRHWFSETCHSLCNPGRPGDGHGRTGGGWGCWLSWSCDPGGRRYWAPAPRSAWPNEWPVSTHKYVIPIKLNTMVFSWQEGQKRLLIGQHKKLITKYKIWNFVHHGLWKHPSS